MPGSKPRWRHGRDRADRPGYYFLWFTGIAHALTARPQALVNILAVSCGVLDSASGIVESETLYDDTGEVFGHPGQVELDVIIQDGLLILCEIKSSLSKADMYTFERKVRFYEKHHDRKVHRALVISPMVEERARPVAAQLGIEVYSYAEDRLNFVRWRYD